MSRKLTREEIDSMFKTKPNLMINFLALLSVAYTYVVSVTLLVVSFKLMWLAWKWLL